MRICQLLKVTPYNKVNIFKNLKSLIQSYLAVYVRQQPTIMLKIVDALCHRVKEFVGVWEDLHVRLNLICLLWNNNFNIEQHDALYIYFIIIHLVVNSEMIVWCGCNIWFHRLECLFLQWFSSDFSYIFLLHGIFIYCSTIKLYFWFVCCSSTCSSNYERFSKNGNNKLEKKN